MREIKFRAWDGEEMNYEVSFLPQWGAIKKGYAGTAWSDAAKAGEIMQYTGLKDKNGKEIYEGDVVTSDHYPFIDDGKQNYVGIVEWVFSSWQLIQHCVNPEKAGISNGINTGLNDNGVLEGGESLWEVIGNIHENPELLESP